MSQIGLRKIGAFQRREAEIGGREPGVIEVGACEASASGMSARQVDAVALHALPGRVGERGVAQIGVA
jgi:hypothetical protein